MIKAVLIDDETSAIKALQALLKEYFSFITVAATATSITAGKKAVLKHQPDLVFLDIELQDGSGFDLLESIPVNFKVIFVTAYSEYALQAIKKRAFDYILKPIDVDELAKTLDEVKRTLWNQTEASSYSSTLSIPCKNGNVYAPADQIIRLDAHGSYCKIFMENGEAYMVSNNLSHFEKMLNPKQFFRCHNSHIINLSKVKKVLQEMGTVAVLSDGAQVDISKRRKAEFNLRMAAITLQ